MEKEKLQQLEQWDIDLNRDEKNALISFYQFILFLQFYFLGFILYIYYKNETKMLEESCSMELQNVSMHIKSEIINKHMKNQEFNPKKN